jgi:hypothetical protein
VIGDAESLAIAGANPSPAFISLHRQPAAYGRDTVDPPDGGRLHTPGKIFLKGASPNDAAAAGPTGFHLEIQIL